MSAIIDFGSTMPAKLEISIAKRKKNLHITVMNLKIKSYENDDD